MRNLDTLFTYQQPADAKRDRSGSIGQAVVSETKRLGRVLQEHIPDEVAADAALDALKGALDIALLSVAGLQATVVPPPPPPIPVIGRDGPVSTRGPKGAQQPAGDPA